VRVSHGQRGRRFLDLGAADGRLLRAANADAELGLAYTDMVGISAREQRHQAPEDLTGAAEPVPDSSYLLFNLDELHRAKHA
jgi:hypothetical protein